MSLMTNKNVTKELRKMKRKKKPKKKKLQGGKSERETNLIHFVKISLNLHWCGKARTNPLARE